MKKRKKCAVFLLVAMILLPVFSVPVIADESEQSEDRITTELMHEHTDEDCWEKVWVPCGGTWNSSFESSVGAKVYYCSNNHSTEVRNGVVLSSIHSGWVTYAMSGTHAGEYASKINCEITNLGTFVIEKTTDGVGSVLTASADVSEDRISNVSVSWRYPDSSTSDKASISLTQNGVYCATLTWTDVKTGVIHRTDLNYTDISSPVTLVFRSGDQVLYKITVSYGDMLPDIDPPVRTGYDFQGFYADNEMWYDSNGHKNDSIRIKGSSLEQIVNASYQARTYNVYYGADSDGSKDYVFQATYDEPYGPIEVTDAEREGWIFDGYYYEGEKVFDTEGRSTGVWRWDSTEDIVLEAVYRRPSAPSTGNNGQGGHSDDSGNNGSGTTQDPPVIDNDQSVSDNGASVSDNSSVSQNLTLQSGNGNGNNGNGSGNNGSNGNGSRNADSERGLMEDEAEIPHSDDRYSNTLLNDRSLSDENQNFDAAELSVSEGSDLLSENMAAEDSIELQRIKNRNAILKAVKVTGITVGILGICYLIGWLFVTKFGLAQIYSVQADGSKRQIGDALILRGENAFHIRIKDRVAGKGDTGRYQIAFSKGFVMRHNNQDVIIHCLGKNISEVVKPDINMFIE